jgi:hypothetical protein
LTKEGRETHPERIESCCRALFFEVFIFSLLCRAGRGFRALFRATAKNDDRARTLTNTTSSANTFPMAVSNPSEATYPPRLLLINMLIPCSYTNPRGIPRAPFVDKVEDFLTSPDDVSSTLRKFDEMLSYLPSNYILQHLFSILFSYLCLISLHNILQVELMTGNTNSWK